METCLAVLRQFGRTLFAGPALPPHLAAVAPAKSTALIRVMREQGGDWTVITADRRRYGGFSDIADAVLCARRSCAAAPTVLWLNIDGLVVVIPQDRGWTRPLIGARNSCS